MKKKLTVRRLLREGADTPLAKLPFGKTLMMMAPDDVNLDPTLTSKDNLALLEQYDEKEFLDTPMEELLVHDENKRIRGVIRCAYFSGLASAFFAGLVILYISVVKMEFPNFTDMLLPLLVPALIMWRQSGVLEGDRIEKVATVIAKINPLTAKVADRVTTDKKEEKPKE